MPVHLSRLLMQAWLFNLLINIELKTGHRQTRKVT